jgi:hypothetical protein
MITLVLEGDKRRGANTANFTKNPQFQSRNGKPHQWRRWSLRERKIAGSEFGIEPYGSWNKSKTVVFHPQAAEIRKFFQANRTSKSGPQFLETVHLIKNNGLCRNLSAQRLRCLRIKRKLFQPALLIFFTQMQQHIKYEQIGTIDNVAGAAGF